MVASSFVCITAVKSAVLLLFTFIFALFRCWHEGNPNFCSVHRRIFLVVLWRSPKDRSNVDGSQDKNNVLENIIGETIAALNEAKYTHKYP